jgi:autotransporter-associated beta strand protein
MALGKFFSQFSLQALGKRFARRFGGTLKRRLQQGVRRRFTRFEHLEDRSLMTVTSSFGAGILTISLNAQDDVATITATSTQGNAFDVTGTNLQGQASAIGVNQIVVQDTGTNTNQTVTFADPTSGGARFNLTGSLSVDGIENVFFSTHHTMGFSAVDIGTATNGVITFSAGINPDTIQTPVGSQNYGNDVVLLGDVGLTTSPIIGLQMGNVNLNGNVLTINGGGTINGAITGGGGLTKGGTGLLILTGATSNTFSGPTIVNSGFLELNKTAGNLAIGGDLFVLGGTVRELNSEQIINTSNVTVNGGTLDFSSFLNLTETVGPLTLLSGSVIGGNANLSFGGDMILSGGTLSGSTRSINVGGSWLNTGTTYFPNNGVVGFGAVGLQNLQTRGIHFFQVVHNAPGTLKLLDNLFTDNNLSNGAGTLDLAGLVANANSFQVTGGTVSTSLPGGFVTSPSPYDVQGGTVSAALTGAVGLTKTSNNSATLSGANTYTGPTSVNSGTLVVNGSVTSNVTVNAPAVLNGTGTFIGNVTGNGTVSPGITGVNNGVGRMHITGNLVPSAGGTLLFDVNSPYNPVNAGVDFDQFVVDGAVDLSSGKLTFANSNDTIAPINNSLLTIISKTSVGPTVPSTNPLDGQAILIGIRTFVISYNGGDGNNVVLKAQTPIVSVAVNPTGVSEIGTNNLTFTFTRDLSAGTLPISFAVTGTAKSGVDYVATSPDAGFTFTPTGGTITFANGSPTATITIDPTPDKLVEPIENVTLTLSAGSIYRVDTPPANTATGQIIDNSITGIVYRDLHGALATDPPDGLRQADEPVAAGVVVYLDLNNDGKLNITEPAVQANNYGSYTFPNVSAGVYTLRELPSAGLGGITQPLTPDGSYIVSVPDGQLSGLNFGNGTGTATDFGDAPDGTVLPNGKVAHYGTLLANNGARAGILSSFRLGILEDGEPDGQQSIDASGDNANGQADEDGVQIQTLPQGGTISIPITVTNGGNGAGKLSAWIDFNANGVFDTNERVIANRVMNSGTTMVSITIPAAPSSVLSTTGPTYARFRYGYETDIGPTGPALAGEVEDYPVFILPANGAPTAVADTFPENNPPELTAVQGSIIKPTTKDYHLDVLGNDLGGLNSFNDTKDKFDILIASQPVIAGTTTNAGTLTVVSDPTLHRKVLSYTPAAGVAGGSNVTFTYKIKDAQGKVSNDPATTDTIHIALANYQAIDDTFTVQAGNVTDPGQPDDGGTSYTGLPAMQNDITPYALSGDVKTPAIIAVGLVASGDYAADSNTPPVIPAPPDGQTSVIYTLPGTSLTATLSINASNPQMLDIKADPGFMGSALFKYEIDENTSDPANSDSNTAPSTRFLTVQIVNGVNGGIGGIGGAVEPVLITSGTGDLTAAHYLATLRTTVVQADAGGNPTDIPTTVHVDDFFYLRVDAQDLRDIPPGGAANNRGVQAAYLDMLLNPIANAPSQRFRDYAVPDPDDQENPMTAIHFVESAPNNYSVQKNGQNGVSGAPSAGEINEAGAARATVGQTGLGTDYNKVFYVKMHALKATPLVAGSTTQRLNLVVAGDPTENAANAVSVTPTDVGGSTSVQLTPDQTFYQPVSFGIFGSGEAEFTNPVNSRDVDTDGTVAASDVLTVINNINANGSRSLLGQTPTANSPMVDVNMDSQVTSMDVLAIINFINSHSAPHRTTTSSTSNTAAVDASLADLSSSDGSQSSSPSTSGSTPTLLTNGTPSTDSSSSSTSSNTSSTGSTTTGSTSTSTGTSSGSVDPSAADDFYSSPAAQQILKRFGK